MRSDAQRYAANVASQAVSRRGNEATGPAVPVRRFDEAVRAAASHDLDLRLQVYDWRECNVSEAQARSIPWPRVSVGASREVPLGHASGSDVGLSSVGLFIQYDIVEVIFYRQAVAGAEAQSLCSQKKAGCRREHRRCSGNRTARHEQTSLFHICTDSDFGRPYERHGPVGG